MTIQRQLSPENMSVKSLGIHPSPQKYDYYGNQLQNKDVLKVDDIKGAHSGTLHKSTLKQNSRVVNPLEPEYNYPGGKELQTQMDNMYTSMRSQYNSKANQLN